MNGYRSIRNLPFNLVPKKKPSQRYENPLGCVKRTQILYQYEQYFANNDFDSAKNIKNWWYQRKLVVSEKIVPCVQKVG